eukprot:scaffold495_cov243-Pinguiococcus_pyrenoidosus.AAC.2
MSQEVAEAAPSSAAAPAKPEAKEKKAPSSYDFEPPLVRGSSRHLLTRHGSEDCESLVADAREDGQRLGASVRESRGDLRALLDFLVRTNQESVHCSGRNARNTNA